MLWGLLEASVFFVVPDVLLTLLATRSIRRALRACVFALGGALVGGVLMYGFAHYAPDTARTVVAAVPAINDALIASVQQQTRQHGLLALFVGPLTGTPYKIYAVQAGVQGISLLSFIAVSVPARLARFVALVLLTFAISRALQRCWTLRTIQRVLIACWSVFYVWYFFVMSG